MPRPYLESDNVMNFKPIDTKYPLVLASGSPRRKSLLRQLRLPFCSITSNIPENDTGKNPEQTARKLSEEKALQVYSNKGSFWTLGADTIVAIDGITLGKPKDRDQAYGMLSLLSGKEHRVITGLSILNPAGNIAFSQAVTTLVKVKKLSRKEINSYILTDEPFGKAGSYAIQGIGSFMIERISGSYTNVVGLPLCVLIESLVSLGALKEFPFPSCQSYLAL